MGYKLADGTDSKGYKAGDRFEVINGKYKGDVLRLLPRPVTDDTGVFINESKGLPGVWFYWSSVKPAPFAKSDLKDGDKLCLRKGSTFYVCGEYGVSFNDGNLMSSFDLSRLLDCLKHDKNKSYDVIRVTRDGKIIFDRHETKKVILELTEEQIDNLKSQGIL